MRMTEKLLETLEFLQSLSVGELRKELNAMGVIDEQLRERVLTPEERCHDGKCTSPGVYVSTYVCSKCNNIHIHSTEDSESAVPLTGCSGSVKVTALE